MSLDILEKLYADLAKDGIHLDVYQTEFLQIYSQYLDNSKSKLRFLKKNKRLKSIYLWGSVGRGKTLLLKALSKELSKNTLILHFNEFMLKVHKFLQSHQGVKDPLSSFCNLVLKDIDILLLDEFQIEDIGDAMIIGKVLTNLRHYNTSVFLSSNYPIEGLYKNGLQREKFIDSISFIKKDFLYFNLLGIEDYRSSKVDHFLKIGRSKLNDEAIKEFLLENFDRNSSFTDIIVLSNRKFSIKGFGKTFIWLDFQVFFSEPTAAMDYMELCDRYKWIFIDNFRKLGDSELNIVRRFISFLDISYTKNSKVCVLEKRDDILDIYEGDSLQHLWIRAQSRLKEALFMN
ncbi:MAG: cell division protein ZapE [Gammaproteobacteria bacterium]